MTTDVRNWLVTLIVALSLTSPAVAGPYEDAVAGYDAEQQGNYAEALRLYKSAAEAGNDYAQYSLATLYITGTGVSQDYAEAANWFRKAAEQGNVDAQFNLARLLDSGTGVAENNAEAAKWYTAPAEQGNLDAQVNLAFLYYSGEGVTKDTDTAVKWFQSAANKGHIGAQYNLGLLLVSDEAPQDFVRAYKWLSLAEDNATDADEREQAAAARSDLEGRMTPAQIAKAETLTSEWAVQ